MFAYQLMWFKTLASMPVYKKNGSRRNRFLNVGCYGFFIRNKQIEATKSAENTC